ALLENQLKIKRSQIPGAGKGLLPTNYVKKGERIVEYQGKITTWKEVNHRDGANGYIFHIQ
ncbi:MAG: SET domain-containing protein, partial [Ferruginibacter sp.]